MYKQFVRRFDYGKDCFTFSSVLARERKINLNNAKLDEEKDHLKVSGLQTTEKKNNNLFFTSRFKMHVRCNN